MKKTLSITQTNNQTFNHSHAFPKSKNKPIHYPFDIGSKIKRRIKTKTIKITKKERNKTSEEILKASKDLRDGLINNLLEVE